MKRSLGIQFILFFLLCFLKTKYVTSSSRPASQIHRRSQSISCNDSIDGITTLDPLQEGHYDLVQIETNGGINDTFTLLGNKSYIGNSITTFCFSRSYETFFYQPITIMLPPENYLFCNPIPIEIISDFHIIEPHYPIGILLSSWDRTNPNCTLDMITNNINSINLYASSNRSKIEYLIIPNSYRFRTNYSIEAKNTSCPYPVTGTFFVEDKIALQIEADMKSWEKQHGGNPRFLSTNNDSSSSPWQFTTMFLNDYNCDSQITWDDYESYHNNSMQQSPEPSRWWMMSLLFIVVFISALYECYDNRQKERQELEARSRIQQLTVTTETTNNTRTGTDQRSKSKPKLLLTEEDFAALPQFTYRLKKRSRRLLSAVRKSTNAENDDNVVVIPIMTTSTRKLDVVAETSGELKLDDDIENNYNNAPIIPTRSLHHESSSIRSLTDEMKNEVERSLHKRQDIWNESTNSFVRSDCCCICLDEFQENETFTALPRCTHFFHTDCIREWLLVRHSDSCPMCKTIILDRVSL